MPNAYFFGCGFGVAFALVHLSWRWLTVVGRATRKHLTMPDECSLTRASVHRMFAYVSEQYRAGRPFPRWYIRYVAFRECAEL